MDCGGSPGYSSSNGSNGDPFGDDSPGGPPHPSSSDGELDVGESTQSSLRLPSESELVISTHETFGLHRSDTSLPSHIAPNDTEIEGPTPSLFYTNFGIWIRQVSQTIENDQNETDNGDGSSREDCLVSTPSTTQRSSLRTERLPLHSAHTRPVGSTRDDVLDDTGTASALPVDTMSSRSLTKCSMSSIASTMAVPEVQYPALPQRLRTEDAPSTIWNLLGQQRIILWSRSGIKPDGTSLSALAASSSESLGLPCCRSRPTLMLDAGSGPSLHKNVSIALGDGSSSPDDDPLTLFPPYR